MGYRKTSWTLTLRLRGIYDNALDDEDFDTVIKNARRTLEPHVESAMQCKAEKNSKKKTLS